MVYLEKNGEYNGFGGGFYGYSPYENFDPMAGEATFNPMAQYEQAYMYYRYLTQVVEYKIKCKEYEKLSGISGREQRRNIKVKGKLIKLAFLLLCVLFYNVLYNV